MVTRVGAYYPGQALAAIVPSQENNSCQTVAGGSLAGLSFTTSLGAGPFPVPDPPGFLAIL